MGFFNLVLNIKAYIAVTRIFRSLLLTFFLASSGTVLAVAVNTRVNCMKHHVYVASTACATPGWHHKIGLASNSSNSSEMEYS
jgi:hypothetical protein